MYKKCDFCKIKKFKVEYSKGHYICPNCEEIIDNYNRSINNCFNNYRYTRENLEKEKHRKDIINELRNIHSNKIILNEFKTDHSFQNEFMEYYIRLAGIESVSSFEDVDILEQKINYIIQEEPLASKKISKELINSYFTELKIELRNIHFNKKLKIEDLSHCSYFSLREILKDDYKKNRKKVVFTEREKVLLNSYVSFRREFKILEYSKEELTILSEKIDDYIEEERSFRESIGAADEMWILMYISIKETIEKELDRRKKGGFILGIPGSGRGYSVKNND